MNIVWGIASYKRADRQPWLMQLHKWGYGKKDIILSTQTKADYEEYSKKWGDHATIIYRQGENVSDNKNTILDYLKDDPRRLVMNSDKLRGVNILRADGKGLRAVETREEMEGLLKYMMETSDKLGGEIAGCYSVENTFFMSHTIHVNQQMLGCFMIFRERTKWRFDHQCPLKEDFEIIMRIIANGGRVVRFNNVSLNQTLHTHGGCYEFWNTKGDAENERCTKYILGKYPFLVRPHSTRKNEIKYIGPSKKIQLKLSNNGILRKSEME